MKIMRKMTNTMSVVAGGVLLAATFGCTTMAPVSGYETDAVACGQKGGSDRYDGCFWNDRLWEENWLTKKSTNQTLKVVRCRLAAWQSIAAVATFGVWVPMYVEWELNGDRK